MARAYQITVSTPNNAKLATVEMRQEQIDLQGWQDLREEMLMMIEQKYLRWVLDVRGLTTVDSTTLGMWVMFNAMVNNRSGRIEFLVPGGTQIDQVLRITKLDRILRLKYAQAA